MAEDECLEDTLRRHADALNARRWRWPLSGPTYHILADALYWVDEAPLWSKLRAAEDPLRCLWHYRTGLIVGEQRPFRDLWELGIQLFPRWVGFHPSRCSPSRRFQVLYRIRRRAADRCFRDLLAEVDEVS
jgi:hypothetical protein